jgi:hypothetical protein
MIGAGFIAAESQLQSMAPVAYQVGYSIPAFSGQLCCCLPMLQQGPEHFRSCQACQDIFVPETWLIALVGGLEMVLQARKVTTVTQTPQEPIVEHMQVSI